MVKQTVVRQSLKDQIKTILIDRMMEGDLAPGDRIKELRVAEEFGTSQSPVREAIRCLETLGYVEHVPHVGAMVKTFDKSEIEEAYQAREALEIHATTLIGAGREELVKELDRYLEQMRQASKERDVRKYTQADNLFHRTIVASCNNKTILSMWESLKVQLQIFAVLTEGPMSLDKVYALHPPIVAAFKDKSQDVSLLLKGHYKILDKYWNS